MPTEFALPTAYQRVLSNNMILLLYLYQNLDLIEEFYHHIIALDINILILDTLPYSSRNTVDPHHRKHDVGLYAMDLGDVYVASVAVFSSYAQVCKPSSADKFKGPSVPTPTKIHLPLIF
jgi:hypothetical protein